MVQTVHAPPAVASIMRTLRNEGTLGIFTRALERSGLGALLEGPLTFTIFAPSDDALRFGPQADLLTGGRQQLEQIVAFHIVPGIFRGTYFNEKAALKTLSGRELVIDRSRFIEPDIACSNGVIHIVDDLLRPAW